LQQEWDDGIAIGPPHWSAIFMQHSRSWAAMALPRSTHAVNGHVPSDSARATIAILLICFIICLE
jgi:hypothetical protein